MKALLSVLFLTLPAFGQVQRDATNPGQWLPTRLGGMELSGSANSATDDFDRAAGTNMGPDWTERTADLNIANNAGHGTSGVAWMTHNTLGLSYIDSVHQIDFLPQASGASVIYVAFTVGSELSSGNNVFVKVQDNTSDGIYDKVFFYKGVNGSSWNSSYAFDLAVPTASGRMQLTFSPDGDVAILDIDRNFDGVFDEQFQANGILGAFGTVGNDYGISTYSDPTFDNWNVNGGAVGTGFCFADSTAVCPCGNNSLEESGCVNSSGTGAILTADGNAVIGADTMVLSVAQATANRPGLFLSGSTSAGVLFGDGFRCVGNQAMYLGVVFTDAAGSAATSFTVSQTEGLTGGELRNYQYWYRDSTGPCGTGYNASNGYAVQW